MKRLTMSLDEDLADEFEQFVRARGYANRSEAFRDLLRGYIVQEHLENHPKTSCIATLSFVYDHHQRQLAGRLTDLQHEHHELTVSSMHAHLDHTHCIEVVILRGNSQEVQRFSEKITTQPGVSHGSLHMVPVVSHPSHGHDHHHPIAD